MKYMLIMLVFYPPAVAPIYSTQAACLAAAKVFRDEVTKQDKVIRNIAVCVPVEQ